MWQTRSAFIWEVRQPPKMFAWKPSATSQNFTIYKNSYRFGDMIQVRVEYRDRVTVDDPGARGSKCKPDDLTCELRPGCFQWITWTVEFL